jgi:hypothetical protein
MTTEKFSGSSPMRSRSRMSFQKESAIQMKDISTIGADVSKAELKSNKSTEKIDFVLV